MTIIRFFLTGMHVLVVVLLCLTMLNSIVPPKIFPWLEFLSLSFPVLFVFHVFLCLFWIFSWKKRAFIFILSTVIFYSGITKWVNFSNKKTEPSNFKLLTFNAHMDNSGKESIEAFITSQNADVVFLQESYDTPDKPYILEYPYHIQKDKIISIFSKYKILNSKDLINDGTTSYALMADIEINEKIYRFVNVYLSPYHLVKDMVKPTNNVTENKTKAKTLAKAMIPIFKEHQNQVKEIMEGLKNSPYPIIMAGDFNSVPNSYENFQFLRNFKDVFVESGFGFSTSFHDYKYPLRIDFVYCENKIKTTSYKVDRSVSLSDHYPITAEFVLK